MLAGGWITDACLETLGWFLIAMGQFVDAHRTRFVRRRRSYLSSDRKGIFDRLCGSVRRSSLFMYLWAMECASRRSSRVGSVASLSMLKVGAPSSLVQLGLSAAERSV
jgi:hypothetical protein